jgi:hypothetical protein
MRHYTSNLHLKTLNRKVDDAAHKFTKLSVRGECEGMLAWIVSSYRFQRLFKMDK